MRPARRPPHGLHQQPQADRVGIDQFPRGDGGFSVRLSSQRAIRRRCNGHDAGMELGCIYLAVHGRTAGLQGDQFQPSGRVASERRGGPDGDQDVPLPFRYGAADGVLRDRRLRESSRHGRACVLCGLLRKRRSDTFDATGLGIFFRNSKIRMADITDGASHTIMVCERSCSIAQRHLGGSDQRGRYASAEIITHVPARRNGSSPRRPLSCRTAI